MPIQIPPSRSPAQVPEYARRYEDLKSRIHFGRNAEHLRSDKREHSLRDERKTAGPRCSPTPAIRVPRVRLPRKRQRAKVPREAATEKNWALRSAGIAVVASLSVSVLINVLMIGLDGGDFAHGALHIGNLLSGMGWSE